MPIVRYFVCNCGRLYKTRSLKRSTYCQQCCSARRERMIAKEDRKISSDRIFRYGPGASYWAYLRRSKYYG